MPRWLPKTDDEYFEYYRSKCIVTEKGCWEWQGHCECFRNQKPGQRGYPASSYHGKKVRVHRWMLARRLGRPLLPKMQACHTCDNPPCCNPEHLYEATNQQNHIDGGKRGRMQGQTKTHCKHGHEFTPENTYYAPRKSGNGRIRNCKECNRIRLRQAWADGRGLLRQRRWRAKQKALQIGGQ